MEDKRKYYIFTIVTFSPFINLLHYTMCETISATRGIYAGSWTGYFLLETNKVLFFLFSAVCFFTAGILVDRDRKMKEGLENKKGAPYTEKKVPVGARVWQIDMEMP